MIGAVGIHSISGRLESACGTDATFDEIAALFNQARTELLLTCDSIRDCPFFIREMAPRP